MKHTKQALVAATAAALAAIALVGFIATRPDHRAEAGTQITGPAKSRSEAQRRIDALHDDAPPAAAAALADGEVSRSEYRKAVDATVQCLGSALGTTGSAAAAKVSPPKLSHDGFTYTYEYSSTSADPDADRQIEQRCRTEHLTAVEEGYHLTVLSDPSFMARVTAGMNDCLDRLHAPGTPDDGVRERVMAGFSASGGKPSALTAGLERCLATYPSVNDLN